MHSERWNLSQLSGRLIELYGGPNTANLTVACGLILEAQKNGDATAWVTLTQSSFYPPDLVSSGILLEELPVVRTRDLRSATNATVQLTQSGGFELIVLDLGGQSSIKNLISENSNQKLYSSPEKSNQKISTPLLKKLSNLAKKQKTAVVILTENINPIVSSGFLISLRAKTQRKKTSLCQTEVVIMKDKRGNPGRRFYEVCLAPAGLY